MVVWIGGTIGNESLETWAARTFEAWRVGVKGEDNGVALFILAKDRRMRIEVGYGLEGLLTDLKSARILREELTPRLREGKRDEAVVAAVNGILGVLGGEEAGAAQRFAPEASQRTVSKWELIGFGVLGLLLLFLIATNPRMAATLLYTLASSGHRGAGFSGGGGYSGGGGGFSGGGGRSGGGGASGSW